MTMKLQVVCLILLYFRHGLYASVDAFAVETTARKRLGKKSFITKQERGHIQKILSPSELKDLVSKNALRRPGSINHMKGWRHWAALAIDSIRHDLALNLPHPADKAKFENLFFRLGVAADMGEMPSFSDPGARSGYALEFFCRARNLADLFVDTHNPEYTFPTFWVDAMLETPMLGEENMDGEGSYNIVSLGGGPAFDFVGAGLATTFSSSGQRASKTLKATIFDYEEGWADLVEAMDDSINKVLQQPQLSCQWGGKCDITKPLDHVNNSECLAEISSTHLWICQYCVAENANLLRQSNFVFFHDLFEQAQEGAIFIFTETHPRIWPEFYNLMVEHCPYMQIGFNRNGRRMLLRKGAVNDIKSVLISKGDEKLLSKFENIGKDHERKINSGWKRQEQKFRGS